MRLRELKFSDLPPHEWPDIENEKIVGCTLEDQDGKILATSGLWFTAGTAFAFFNLFDERARLPFLLHREVRNALDGAKRAGIREILATCDYTQPRAEAWLRRLGFRKIPEPEKTDYHRKVEELNEVEIWQLCLVSKS